MEKKGDSPVAEAVYEGLLAVAVPFVVLVAAGVVHDFVHDLLYSEVSQSEGES